MKANLKNKEEANSSEEWESDYEEDAPVVHLEELLGNMKICGDDSDGNGSGEEEKKN